MSGKDYRIIPPPKDAGVEPLFRVVYAIDVNAADEKHAAETAWQMMCAEDAFDPILMVLNAAGKQTQLDLSDQLEFNKIIKGSVVQKFRKNSTGKFICIHQQFKAGDDIRFESIKGRAIEKPQHEYQPYDMSLLSTFQIIDRIGDVLTSIDVGGEQSRQFATEIQILDKLLRDLGFTKK